MQKVKIFVILIINFGLIIEKKTANIRSCMARMGETCNHVAAAMYNIEAAVRT